ncbi:subtype B tannase [Alloscardovia macacae]|uniref:Alpha/beta hydrolase n=1 Tax=Alloscardovia macacae TaxID=1160091 RepID=A0A261F722_9BIFI|nr:subtype B tannase [Alloscardovia macacae]OZG54941.1 alpha/beta hydrolase [Alloscardovia macacae]
MTDLTFAPDQYTVHTLTRDGQTLTYRAFENIPYALHPDDAAFQRLSIYVPEAFYAGQSVHGYTLSTAPIFLPNTVGGYMPGPQEAPGVNFLGETNATFYALLHGYVVVSPGVRGRGMTNADGQNIGVAPAALCDLKAAVRFLRHNATTVPGDTEKIISNGTSAGGALSSLLASTGNHPDYAPYLAAMGAADERDDIFAASCYCPITNLDHADMAYEWEFHTLLEYHMVTFLPPRDGEKEPRKLNKDGLLTAHQQTLSAQLHDAFQPYLQSLPFWTGEPEAELRELIENTVLASAQKALDAGAPLADDPAVTAWLTVDGGQATRMDWDGYIRFRTRMKETPAFDALNGQSPENELFGTAHIPSQHFTAVYGDESRADAHIIRMMNPMTYHSDTHATLASHVRLRHGSMDRDTSLAISALLYLSFQKAGVDVNLEYPWGLPHAGDYDLDELFAWIDSLCA